MSDKQTCVPRLVAVASRGLPNLEPAIVLEFERRCGYSLGKKVSQRLQFQSGATVEPCQPDQPITSTKPYDVKSPFRNLRTPFPLINFNATYATVKKRHAWRVVCKGPGITTTARVARVARLARGPHGALATKWRLECVKRV